MDAQLAAIYGTGQMEEETDIEKMAAAELLVKLAEEEGVDLDSFDDQEIAEMVSSLYKSASDEEKKEEEKKEKEGGFEDLKKKHEEGESEKHEEKEESKAEEKVAEADFLGRVMAHAYVQELGEIEKEAGKVGDTLKKGKEAVTGFFRSQKQKAGLGARQLKSGITGKGSVAGTEYHGQQRKNMITQGLKNLAPAAAAGTAVAGGAAVGAHHLFKKKDKDEKGKKKHGSADESALEAMAAELAFGLAKEAGYIDEEGNFLVETQTEEKQASALDQAVYARALEICEQNGIPVEWNE